MFIITPNVQFTDSLLPYQRSRLVCISFFDLVSLFANTNATNLVQKKAIWFFGLASMSTQWRHRLCEPHKRDRKRTQTRAQTMKIREREKAEKRCWRSRKNDTKKRISLRLCCELWCNRFWGLRVPNGLSFHSFCAILRSFIRSVRAAHSFGFSLVLFRSQFSHDHISFSLSLSSTSAFVSLLLRRYRLRATRERPRFRLDCAPLHEPCQCLLCCCPLLSHMLSFAAVCSVRFNRFKWCRVSLRLSVVEWTSNQIERFAFNIFCFLVYA